MPNLLAIYCSSLNITSDRNRSFAKEIQTFSASHKHYFCVQVTFREYDWSQLRLFC